MYEQGEYGVYTEFARLLSGEPGDLRRERSTFSYDYLVRAIQNDPDALSYIDYAYYPGHGEGVRLLGVDAGDGCVAPTADSIQQGTYNLITEPLLIYVNKLSLTRPEVRAFAEYYMKEAFRLVPAVRYVPLASEEYRKNLALLMACTTPEMRLRDGNILDGLNLPDCVELPP